MKPRLNIDDGRIKAGKPYWGREERLVHIRFREFDTEADEHGETYVHVFLTPKELWQLADYAGKTDGAD